MLVVVSILLVEGGRSWCLREIQFLADGFIHNCILKYSINSFLRPAPTQINFISLAIQFIARIFLPIECESA